MGAEEYAKAVVSAQIGVVDRHAAGHLMVWEPKLQGYSWPGGYFFPRNNMYDAVKKIVHMETGIKFRQDLPQTALSLRPSGSNLFNLRRITYSRTLQHGHWVANHSFAEGDVSDILPIEEWDKPADPDYSVVLVDTDSLVGHPRIIKTIYGKPHDFRWGIADGPCNARVAWKDYRLRLENKRYLPDIPVVEVPFDKDRLLLPQGWGLNTGNLIVPHTYKEKHGYVTVINGDTSGFALIGGKVGTLRGVSSRNIDIRSCITTEAKEEIGVDFLPISIVGCAMTPLNYLNVFRDKEVKPGECNSIVTTSILARPVNPRQLDEAISNPDRYISKKERGKIKGIYFLPDDEYEHVVRSGLMRTPDMAPFARQHLNGVPEDRPSLESIVVISDDKKRPGNGPLPAETRNLPMSKDDIRANEDIQYRLHHPITF